MSKIITAGILEAVSSRQDKSIVLRYSTLELAPEEVGVAFGLCGVYSKIMITDNNITPVTEALIEQTALPDGKKAKTPSQRLRNVLFRLHEQQGLAMPFEDFYATEMEKFIIGIKQNLE